VNSDGKNLSNPGSEDNSEEFLYLTNIINDYDPLKIHDK
jgi:hypothetical protein